MQITRPTPDTPRGFGPYPAIEARLPANPDMAVSLNADFADSAMSDPEREYAIREAGKALERAQHEYQLSGCFHDCAARDEARRYMEALIRARSPAQVRQMERTAGLA